MFSLTETPGAFDFQLSRKGLEEGKMSWARGSPGAHLEPRGSHTGDSRGAARSRGRAQAARPLSLSHMQMAPIGGHKLTSTNIGLEFHLLLFEESLNKFSDSKVTHILINS